MFYKIILFLGAAFFAAVCLPAEEGAAGLPPAADRKVSYEADVKPLLERSCYRCHKGVKHKGDLRLDRKSAALRGGESGKVLLAGKSAESVLIHLVAATDPKKAMPPGRGKRLTAAEVGVLRAWIDQGLDWPEALAAENPASRTHWAFQSLRLYNPGKVSNPDWVRTTIDHFVLLRLDQEGLKPAPEADRHTIIRRLSLDLTGLPPTIEEVDAFVNDKSDRAYEALVDRLLTSKGYGERWARVWLDLARYADSAGYAQDPERTIWAYRDWVIGAINDNLPFDQFTIEQLAGDMLPNATESQKIATGFHRNTMTNSEGGTDDEEFRVAAVVDRINTTMQVWMGMTFGCAQCHSHKYDPISQEEYYRFFAIWNQSEDADRGNESPTLKVVSEAQKLQRTAYEQEIAALEKKSREAAAARKLEIGKGPIKPRFVRVGIPGRKIWLSLAEVQIFSGGENLAVKGKARQSSTGFNGPAALAIDGNTDGDHNVAKSTTHTKEDQGPWWEVDLGSASRVDKVVIWNRTDGDVGYRLAGFRVALLDADRKPLFVHSPPAVPKPSIELTVPESGAKLSDAQKKEILAFAGSAAASPEAAKIAELKKKIGALKTTTSPVMAERPANRLRKTNIHVRGNFKQKGRAVQPGTPAVFPALPEGSKPDRLGVARWLVDSQNPLTARVIVNRYWEQLFGIGLVETSEDFGLQGAKPSHRALLDHLALYLLREKWNIRQLLKFIVTSRVYRQSSRVTDELAAKDPRNRLLARGPRLRLSAEMIRDQALAVSGLLDRKMLGPSVRPPQPALGNNAAFGGSTDWKTSAGGDKYRRGLYTKWRRTSPYPSMVTFDAPSREFCTIRRISTNTPLQALVTLNDPVYVEAAQALARRLLTEGGAGAADKAAFGFRLVLSRPPGEKEKKLLVDLFDESRKLFASSPVEAKKMATSYAGAAPEGADLADLAAWAVVGNVLLNLDETIARP
ncbi:MAG: DUF1553 domain-containing protein [Planctomycetota bacterium]|jgi:hypothetical protein|nr:DUF1553 domain-containing protein [Planctomycetota bacterium]